MLKFWSGLALWKKIAILVALVVGLIYGAMTLWHALHYESTDDAYIGGHVYTISSRVSGSVRQRLVDDGMVVKAGDLLVELDPSDFQTALDRIRGQAYKASRDYARVVRMGGQRDPEEIPIVDQYTAAEVESRAAVRAAELQLSYTQIRAPADGTVGKRTVEVGNWVSPGQPLLAVVGTDMWVIANFKENQIAKMRPGQEAEIEVDAIPDHTFKAKVDSIGAATGASFALIPPENATGNFTKIVQRVPVKVLFDAESMKGYEARLRIGLSTITSIRVEK